MSIEAIFAISILLVLLGLGVWIGFYFLDRRAIAKHNFLLYFGIPYVPYRKADGRACNALYTKLLELARASEKAKLGEPHYCEHARWFFGNAERIAMKAGYKDQVEAMWQQMATETAQRAREKK